MITVTNSHGALDMCASGADRTLQNVNNFLRLWQGEVPYERGMGLNPDIVGRPARTAAAYLREQITAGLAEYVPEADVSEVRVYAGGDGRFAIEVDVNE